MGTLSDTQDTTRSRPFDSLPRLLSRALATMRVLPQTGNMDKAYSVLGCDHTEVQRSRALETLGALPIEYTNRFEGDRDMRSYERTARLLPGKALRVLGTTSEAMARTKALSVLGVSEEELCGALPAFPRRRRS